MEQVDMPQPSINEISFTSLGTTVLDDIYINDELTAHESPGGAAIFSALGARLFARPGSRIALKVITGDDFPVKVEQTLRSWNLALDIQRMPNIPSTRAELRYADRSLDSREFRYLTPVLQPKPSDLQDSPILAAKVFHLLSTPQEVATDVTDLLRLRQARQLPRPLILWEPRPTSCIPANFLPLHEAIKHVDVFSPNHGELFAYFDEPVTTPFKKVQTEILAQYFVDSGVDHDGDGVVVIRCGQNGALIVSRTIPVTWVPAYWISDDAAGGPSARHPEVVDTTGAGNCFLGGFAMGLLKTGDPIIAASYGAVSSSFVVQQLGLPVLESGGEDGVQGCEEVAESVERWNGDSVRDRLEVQLSRAARQYVMS